MNEEPVEQNEVDIFIQNVDIFIQNVDIFTQNEEDICIQNENEEDIFIQNKEDIFIKNDVDIFIQKDVDIFIQNEEDIFIQNEEDIFIQNEVDIYSLNEVDIYSKGVMDSSRIEQNKSGRDDKNKIEILDIFQHLNTKLPEGCLVNEGHIQIEFSDRSKKTHGFKKKNQLPKPDTKDTMTKDDLLKICHEVQKLSKHLYRGWRFTRIIISKDDHLYDVLGGLARMAKESKHPQGWMTRRVGHRKSVCPMDGRSNLQSRLHQPTMYLIFHRKR